MKSAFDKIMTGIKDAQNMSFYNQRSPNYRWLMGWERKKIVTSDGIQELTFREYTLKYITKEI